MHTLRSKGLGILFILLMGNFSYGQLNFNKLKNAVKGTSSHTSASAGESAAAPANTSSNFANKGRDWYVSQTNGSGQLGTKEKPARDLGNIIHHLKTYNLTL